MRSSALFLLLALEIAVFSPGPSSGQWIETNGPGAGLIFSLAVKGEDLLAGTFQGGIFRSSDNGANWTDVNSGLGNLNVWSLAIMESDLFAATDGGVFLSTDNGSNWTEVNSGLLLDYGYSSLAVNGTSLFAGAPIGGIFRSDNRGASWTDVTTIDIEDFLIKTLAASNGTIFAGTYTGSMYRSTNNGESWASTNNGLPQEIINAIVMNGNAVLTGTDTGVFISTNNGATWTGANAGLPSGAIRVRSFAKSGALVYAGTKNGVFLSSDNGATWTAVNSGLGDTNVTALGLSMTNLFAGTFSGVVWRLSVGNEPVKQRLRNTGDRFSFDLIPPSRSNGNATVRFSLSHEAQIDIAVFCISGHRTASLIKSRMSAGTYGLSWNTRNLPPGVYVVKMQAGASMQSRNIVIVR